MLLPQAGKWVDFTLPALTQGPASLVQLTPDWTVQQAANGRPDGVPVFYLSYRASEASAEARAPRELGGSCGACTPNVLYS